MRSLFIVVSGLPGSGKTTLARRLAPLLDLPVIDKDEILERLFESKGTGDLNWRRSLSRDSDVILQREAEASGGAILSSFWHLPQMPSDSGTPTEWMASLDQLVVHVRCVCDADIAAGRFARRKRHPGHLDHLTSHADLLVNLQRIAILEPLDVQPRLDVDTSQPTDVDALARTIRATVETVT